VQHEVQPLQSPPQQRPEEMKIFHYVFLTFPSKLGQLCQKATFFICTVINVYILRNNAFLKTKKCIKIFAKAEVIKTKTKRLHSCLRSRVLVILNKATMAFSHPFITKISYERFCDQQLRSKLPSNYTNETSNLGKLIQRTENHCDQRLRLKCYIKQWKRNAA